MRTISYYKNEPQHGEGQVFLDLDLFFKALAIQTDARIIAEPGDATHYELYTFNIDDETDLYAVPDKHWSIITCYLGIFDLPEDWNPHAKAVIADLAQARQEHYAWKRSRYVDKK